ncbi:MAG: hypothetical protein JWL74_1970 [Alphaproteobacteria bacterium]|jgi:hypothetical protein|nr:hypothetical protein [Alphaproteobacteria bacterium]
MQISIQPVRLDTRDGDGDAILVFRNGHLLAVASRLSDHHGRLSGSYFIEAIFGPNDQHVGATFASEDEIRRWAEFVEEARLVPHPAPMPLSGRS